MKSSNEQTNTVPATTNFNADEFIHDYYQSLMYVKETVAMSGGATRGRPTNNHTTPSSPSKTTADTAFNSAKIYKEEMNRIDYKEMGERYIMDLK